MRISNQSFPHPVLGIKNDVNSEIKAGFNWECDRYFYYLKPKFNTNNQTILDLINSGKANYITEVECPSTFYREIFSSKEPSPEFKISADVLRGEVQISLFAALTQRIGNYKIENSHSDFSGYAFNLEAGDIVAYFGQTDFLAVVKYDALRAASSIMVIEQNDDKSDMLNVNYSGDKIRLALPYELYGKYIKLKSDPENTHILHCAFVFPVLVKAIEYIGKEDEEFCEKQWYFVIKKRIEDENLLADLSDESKHFEIAQKLFGSPINRMLESLASKYEEE